MNEAVPAEAPKDILERIRWFLAACRRVHEERRPGVPYVVIPNSALGYLAEAANEIERLRG